MRTILTPSNRNVKPAYLQFDTLDDRREIYHLLGRLSPMKRIAFMRWFLSKATLGPWPAIKPEVAVSTVRLAQQAMSDDAADEKLRMDCWIDLWSTSSAYEGLSLDLAFNKLTELVRVFGRD